MNKKINMSIKEITFKESTFERIIDLALEADENRAFLPEKDDPDFKVVNFLKGYINRDSFYLYELTDGLSAVGFVSILPTKDENMLAIGPMYISKKHRGLGLGKRLVDEIINWAQSKKVHKLFTKTWGQNAQSRKIFESLGFICAEEKLNQRINGDSTVKYIYDIV